MELHLCRIIRIYYLYVRYLVYYIDSRIYMYIGLKLVVETGDIIVHNRNFTIIEFLSIN